MEKTWLAITMTTLLNERVVGACRKKVKLFRLGIQLAARLCFFTTNTSGFCYFCFATSLQVFARRETCILWQDCRSLAEAIIKEGAITPLILFDERTVSGTKERTCLRNLLFMN